VPGDLAAAVDVDDGRAVRGPFVARGARARREDGLVLEQQQRVGAVPGDDLGVDSRCGAQASGRARGARPTV
jgi:hypothetical protein